MSAVESSKTSTSHHQSHSFVSRFRFGKNKHNQAQQQTTDQQQQQNDGALHEINGQNIADGIPSIDRSISPATTVTSSNSSASPNENKQSWKSSKGLFGSASKSKSEKKKEKEKAAAVHANGSLTEKDKTFKKFFSNISKHLHHQSPAVLTRKQQGTSNNNSSNNTPNGASSSVSPAVTDSATAVTTSNCIETMVLSSEATDNVPLLVTASAVTATSSTSIAHRPTYLPAMVAADNLSSAMSPGVLSGASGLAQAPLSPPDSGGGPTHQSSHVSSASSYNHRSTAALPATNPYVKPRAPSSSRPASPAASPSTHLAHQETPPAPPKQQEEEISTGFIFRPRLARPLLSQQPAASATATAIVPPTSSSSSSAAGVVSASKPPVNTNSKSPFKNNLITSTTICTANNSKNNNSVFNMNGAELLTPSSVESLETRLIAKSMVAPSPPTGSNRKFIGGTNKVSIGVGSGNIKVTPPASQTGLLPRVAPLAKVDSLDTNLSISGFQTQVVENGLAKGTAVACNGSNRNIDDAEIDELVAAEENASSGAQRLDFARFLQNLADERGVTSTCMRQSYSLDLRQIPTSLLAATTATTTNNNNNQKLQEKQPTPCISRPSNPEPTTAEPLLTSSSPPFSSVSPETCVYCHHTSRDGSSKVKIIAKNDAVETKEPALAGDASPTNDVGLLKQQASVVTTASTIADPMQQSTLTDITFTSTSEMTIGSADQVDLTKSGGDASNDNDYNQTSPQPTLLSEKLQDGNNRESHQRQLKSLESTASSTSSGVVNNKSSSSTSNNLNLSEFSMVAKMNAANNDANSAAVVNNSLDPQCIEGLSHDVASLRTIIEQLRGHILVTEPEPPEPAQTADAMTETEEVFEDPKAVGELRKHVLVLEKEMARRDNVIEKLEKLLVEQKRLLDARKEEPPPILCTTTATNTEAAVPAKTTIKSTQTDVVDKKEAAVVTVSNGHHVQHHPSGISPPTVAGATAKATVLPTPTSTTSHRIASGPHIAKVLIVNKPSPSSHAYANSTSGSSETATGANSPSPAFGVGSGHASLRSPVRASPASRSNGTTPLSTAIPVSVVASSPAAKSNLVKPHHHSGLAKPTTAIYRRTAAGSSPASGLPLAATTSVPASSSTPHNNHHQSPSSTASSPSSAASAPPSRLPRLSNSSAIPTPISVTGSGR